MGEVIGRIDRGNLPPESPQLEFRQDEKRQAWYEVDSEDKSTIISEEEVLKSFGKNPKAKIAPAEAIWQSPDFGRKKVTVNGSLPKLDDGRQMMKTKEYSVAIPRDELEFPKHEDSAADDESARLRQQVETLTQERDDLKAEVSGLRESLNRLRKDFEDYKTGRTEPEKKPEPAEDKTGYATVGVRQEDGSIKQGYIPLDKTRSEKDEELILVKSHEGGYEAVPPDRLVRADQTRPAPVRTPAPADDPRYRSRNTWLTRRRYGYRDVPAGADYIYTDPASGRPYYTDGRGDRIYVSERRGIGALAAVAGAVALLGIGYIAHEVEENEHNIAKLQHAQTAEPRETIIVNGKKISLDRDAVIQLQRLSKFDKAAARKDAARDWRIFKAEKNYINQKIANLQRVMTRQHQHDHGHEMLAIHGNEFKNGKPNSYFHPDQNQTQDSSSPAAPAQP